MNNIISGKIEKLAFGGEGILKPEGFVVFVPFAAPGDHLTCRITQRKKNFAYGKILSIQSPSPHRVKAPCPYFGRCGGCQLQHLDYSTQLEQKRLWVEDSLKRIGHLTLPPLPPVIPATLQWAYRRHVSLHLKPSPQGFSMGYIAVDHTSLLPIQQCPIFSKADDPVFKDLEDIVKKLDCHPKNEGRITLLKTPDDKYLLHFHFKRMPSNAQTIAEKALTHHAQWSGVILSAPRNTISFGEIQAETEVEGLKFQISPRTFLQNHPEQSQNIYRALMTIAKDKMRVLDLYCGIGISSLLLARQGASVTGVEYNANAVKLARQNAQYNGVKGSHFIQGDVKEKLEQQLQEIKPDLVVLNPPREGIDPQVAEILRKHKPCEIVYISCMPPTLARDLKLCVGDDYRIQMCQAFDMFPQTAHVETLVHLKTVN